MQIKLGNQLFVLHTLWLSLTVAAFIILINLSWWQMQRAEQKAVQLQQLAAQQARGPLDWLQLNQQTVADVDGLMFQQTARWLRPYSWLVDNQIVNGQIGYDVIVPAQFNDTDTVLLVNLGWIAAPAVRTALPQLDIADELMLNGLLRTKVNGLLLLGQNMEPSGQWPERIQQVDFDALQHDIGRPVFPALLYQQPSQYFVSHYKAVVMPPEKHRAYALQWLLLAVAVIGVGVASSHQGRATRA